MTAPMWSAPPSSAPVRSAGSDPGEPSLRGLVISATAIMLALVGGVAGWSLYARLDSAAIAAGQVVVNSHRKTVQHLEGGILRVLLVKEGDVVKAGTSGRAARQHAVRRPTRPAREPARGGAGQARPLTRRTAGAARLRVSGGSTGPQRRSDGGGRLANAAQAVRYPLARLRQLGRRHRQAHRATKGTNCLGEVAIECGRDLRAAA